MSIAMKVDRFVGGEVTSRLDNACGLLQSPIRDICHGVIGIISGIGALLTVGVLDEFNLHAHRNLSDRFSSLFAHIFQHALGVINPHTSFHDKEGGFFLTKVNGFLPSFETKPPRDSWGIGLRLAFAVKALANIVARLADFCLGLIAAACSLVTLGFFNNLNNFAFNSLKVTGIVDDVLFCALNVLNPWCIRRPTFSSL